MSFPKRRYGARRSCVHLSARLAIAALVSVLLGSQRVTAEPEDFHELSPSERDAWINQLGNVLEEAKRINEKPAPPEPLLPGSWKQAPGPWKPSSDSVTWRIDESGFVVLEDGRRLMGSRIFARSCFLQHGDSFRRWASAYSQNLTVAHLVATAITESGCSEAEAQGSVDGKSTGLMQVTGYTCETLLPLVGRSGMREKDCLKKMAEDADFSIELAAAYMTHPAQVHLTDLDPPKVAAAYNAGGLYFDAANPWRLRSTGNHIDRFVAAYNSYVAWQVDERAGRRTRSPAVPLSHTATLPKAIDNPAALKDLTSLAREGDIVFVGDWKTKRGDFYVLVRGEWRGSLEDTGS